MRKTLVSLIALGTAAALSATAFAQDTAPATAVTTTTTTSSSATTTAPADPTVPATTVVTPPTTTVTTTPAPADATTTTTNSSSTTTMAPANPAVPAMTVVTPATTTVTTTPAPADATSDTTTTTTTTATTVTTTAPPAAPPAVPVVEAPPPPPPAPTDPVTIQVLNTVEQICKPMVQGGDLASLAKAQGYRKNRDNSWTLRLDKPYQITVLPQGVNKTVCDVDILHAIGGDAPITVGVHNYAIARGYTLYRNDEFTTDLKRHTRSWELAGTGQTEALVLVTEKNPDGSPVAKNADHSTLMYSLTRQ